MGIWGRERLGRSSTISWCSGVSLWLRHCSYTEPCSCVQCWYSLWAAPDTCLFPPNRLAEDVNTMNQIPLTNRRACFSRWNVRESSALRVAPEQTQLFFSVQRWNLSVITGFEAGWKIWHMQTTCNLAAKSHSWGAMGLEVIRGFRDLLWLRLRRARQLLERHINFQRQITIITTEFQNRKH